MTWEKIGEFADDALDSLEAYYAEQYESYIWQRGYNMVECGGLRYQWRGRKHTTATKAKMSEAKRGRVYSAAVRARMSQGHRKQYAFIDDGPE